MNRQNTIYDVAVIGLGPVGAMATLILAEAGLNVVAIERDAEIYKLPRAVNLDGEILRAFQPLGRAETVDQLMQTTRPGSRAGFADAKREWLFGHELDSFGSNGWQTLNMFDQPEFEQYLRSEATGHENVTVLIGAELTAIKNVPGKGDESTAKVSMSVAQEGNTQTLESIYAIACDGASSFVRKSLGIGWKDLGYNHDWLVVDVTVNEKHTLPNDTLQVCDPDRITTYVCTKDPYRRWEFKFNPGDTHDQMLRSEKITELLEAWTPASSYEIRRAATYQFHAATADTWQIENIFIAGDAAHQTPPFLGQGMNAGMRDAINLGWKLPLVINKVSGHGLLETYESERAAHAEDLVQWAVSVGQLMEHTAETERAARMGHPPPEPTAQLQSSGYGQGREQPPIRDGVVIIEQVSDKGSTGYLFSQPEVITRDGRSLKLDELLGAGFSLVARNDRAMSCSNQSDKILNQLNVRRVSLEGMKETRGHFDRLFTHAEVAIVRPDRIVFGHTDGNLSLDNLVQTLARKLMFASAN